MLGTIFCWHFMIVRSLVRRRPARIPPHRDTAEQQIGTFPAGAHSRAPVTTLPARAEHSDGTNAAPVSLEACKRSLPTLLIKAWC